MLCVPSARHVFGTASLASSALSASAELLVVLAASLFRPDLQSPAKEKLLGMAEAGLFYRSNVLPVAKPLMSDH